MIEIVLDSLKRLISDTEAKSFKDIDGHFSDCWEEFFTKERDTNIPPDVLLRNREILEELVVAVQAFQAKSIGLERLNRIKSKLLKEK
nr:hypothetical protein [Candidatus Freyarchaeota archaeon]